MLSKNIRAARTARGMSQVELARRLNVTKQSVSNWENDNIQPSVDMLKRLSEVLETSADCLLGIDDCKYLRVDNLSEEQIAHLQLIINDISSI